MTRGKRPLIVALTLAVLAMPLTAGAQQAGRVSRIGLLLTGSPTTESRHIETFKSGLRELGYNEGQNIAFSYRWAMGTSDQFPVLAIDLVRANVDLILTFGTTATTAAKKATRTIPILFVAVGDPVGSRLVESLARPGGNITGFTNVSAELSVKLLEFVKELVPGLTRAAVLRNPANPASIPQLRQTQVAAKSLEVQLQPLEVRDPSEFESAFAAISRERAGALIVLPDPMFLSQRTRIADLAAKSRLPSIFNWAEYVEAGGLMGYGPSLPDTLRRAASYADRILKGAKPSDLPVEQPAKFELIINLKTARMLGLTIPPSLLLRVDRILD